MAGVAGSCSIPNLAYDTVAVCETARARGTTVVVPAGQDGERIWPRPAVARAGSDDHAGEAARTALLEAGVRAGWRTRSFDTRQFSEMVFAPGTQLGRGMRLSSAARS